MFTRVNIFRNRIKGDGNESRNEHLPGGRKESPGSDPTRAIQINSQSVSLSACQSSQSPTSTIFLTRPHPIVNNQT